MSEIPEGTVTGDTRGSLVRWWQRHTIETHDLEGELIARTIVRFDWIGRLLILFGRSVELHTITDADEKEAEAVCKGFRVSVRHIPRRWGTG